MAMTRRSFGLATLAMTNYAHANRRDIYGHDTRTPGQRSHDIVLPEDKPRYLSRFYRITYAKGNANDLEKALERDSFVPVSDFVPEANLTMISNGRRPKIVHGVRDDYYNNTGYSGPGYGSDADNSDVRNYETLFTLIHNSVAKSIYQKVASNNPEPVIPEEVREKLAKIYDSWFIKALRDTFGPEELPFDLSPKMKIELNPNERFQFIKEKIAEQVKRRVYRGVTNSRRDDLIKYLTEDLEERLMGQFNAAYAGRLLAPM